MSCGPINPLQQLTKHSQADRSLHHDPQQQRAGPSSSFRTQQPNTLERDFQAHLQQSGQQFQPQAFAHHGMQPQLPLPQAQRPMGGAQARGSWANEFKSSQAPQASAQAQRWNAQFMQQMNSQHTMNASPVQQQQQHHMQATRFQQTPMMTHSYQPQLSQNYSLAGTSRMTEHQELHSAYLHSQLDQGDVGFDALDEEFDKLEKQFEKVKMDEPQMKDASMEIPAHNNNAGFRDAAKQVADAMKTNQSNKFANSKFLDLMNRVSAGQVSLNEDETKLVDTQGNDIHEQKTRTIDPSTQRAEPGSHARLPDPLEFVKDGDLSTPFQSAKLVGQQHGEKYSWDDVYEDYKHEDTSF